LEEFYVKTTYYAKKGEVQRDWVLVDADGMVLGRLAAQVASILRGKNKPQFTPHVDCGDYVVVINAEKVRVTGNKENDKAWHHYTGYPGGLKTETWKQAMAKHPERIIERAVKGMLPKSTLGHEQLLKLKVFAGPEHTYQDKNPRKIELEA
jgi:large subunit ribosomal protein L13